MKINIEKSQIWTPCEPPMPPHFFIIGPILLKFFTQYVKSKKKTLFVREFFSI